MRTVLLVALCLVACDRGRTKEQATKSRPSFAERRAHHRTVLTRTGPAPQDYVNTSPPEGVEDVRYRSGQLELRAWFAHPRGAARTPALVYFHGGFAFGADDFDAVQSFRDKGFAVMTPTLRGENGNPGQFEAYYGEVDDARAAIAWLRARPDIDPAHVYAFGHSAGGVISALVSMYPDSGLRMSGSAGGLYDTSILAGLEVFALTDEEYELRAPAGNVIDLKVPHVAFAGRDDGSVAQGIELAERARKNASIPLTIEILPGDHHSSLAPAVTRFLALVRADAVR